MEKLLVLLATFLVAVRAGYPVIDTQAFIAGNLLLSGQLYKEIAKSGADNFIFSPFSLEIALGLVEAGANGKTAQEIITGLSLPNTTEATETALNALLPSFRKYGDNLHLATANKIYVDNQLKIKDSYKNVAQRVYRAGAENLDFTNANEAANLIDSWVMKETNNKIKDLVTADDVANAKMVVVNALYFMGKWSYPFGETDYETTVAKFYQSTEKAVDVDMMHTVKNFNYLESDVLNAKFLELPYKEGVTMTIILPNEVQGLSNLESNLEALFAPQTLERKGVDVSLPKWEAETSLDFNSILENLGVTSLFTSEADLSGISDEPLFISKVVQKAFINVTESGTEAAAATEGSGATAVLPPRNPVTFLADHPFLYYIKHNGVILFVGKTSIPTSH